MIFFYQQTPPRKNATKASELLLKKTLYNCYIDDCDDTDERAVLGLITIPSALMGIVSLVGSIYGCIITCPCCLTNEVSRLQDTCF